ncbi:MAG: hypothetical protein M1829_003747 [Trizodia sp. TS-e1964]|nr:MAG: hypothetical protein M1829_003747 [Trizodia sp. TS-e1964]
MPLCYNVCPNDSGIGAASSAKTTYCNLSNQYPSTSSSAFSAATTTSSSASASGSNTASATDTNSGAVRTTGTGTGSSPTATKTNAAIAGAVVPAGGFVLALFGVLEAIL